MPRGERIIVPFDRQLWAYGEAASLLSSTCGCIATYSNNVPINFDSWPKVPKSYNDDCFNILKVDVEYNVVNFAILECVFSFNAFLWLILVLLCFLPITIFLETICTD